ncbi:MAG: 5-aminovalerate aminotransferase DavT [Acidimicrobiales bacterium]|nr:5-aminovalerate aminotransferase DavT [Acidimicrobiales bacterium]
MIPATSTSPGVHAGLLDRHRAVLPSWLALYYQHPIELVDGEGCWVSDAEGRRYLDFFGGILTTLSGHNVPAVVEAIRDQAGRILHTSTLYLIEPMIELAEEITSRSGIPDAKVFFTTSGTEATDAALMLATNYRRSNQVLALRNSYHGRSFAAMGVTGNRSWSASNFSPLSVHYVHGGYRFRSPFKDLEDADYTAACVNDLRDVIAYQTAGDLACMIAEPVQGVGGFVVPPDGFLGAMAEVLRDHGALLISDEVQTGWGRTGEHFWGYEAHGVVPDLLTFAKGLGNGLAIGGVVARAEIMDALDANHISTFGGNPLATAGALANLRYMLEHGLQENTKRVGSRMIEELRNATSEMAVVGEVRGRGLMIGLELVEPDGYEPASDTAAEVMELTRSGGLLIGRGGLYGNCLRIAPPMSVSDTEADRGLEIVMEALHRVDRR